MSNKLITALLVADLFVVNVGVGLGVYKLFFGSEKSVGTRSTPVVVSDDKGEITYIDQCGAECKKYVDEKIAGIPVVTNVAPTPTIKPVAATKSTTPNKTRREEMLTIPGSGSSASNTWEDLASTQFYFDTRDYPGLVEVYFEANMKLTNGNGVGYVRLFDVTNLIAVVGGENNTASQVDVWTKSQKVYFWSGRNLIRVQAKSLTADTTVYNQGRLRIITEN